MDADFLTAELNQYIQALDYGVLPDVDPSTLSARFRICTPRLDREGDIIEPSGVDWSDYQFSPVVKYEHGFSGIPFPVARSSDANGNCHVYYGGPGQSGSEVEDALYARAFFSENNDLSYQTFGLIDEGLLRAASIHVLPIEGKPLPNDRLHALSSSMMEWSVCTVGMNPDAYAKSLTKDSKFSELLSLQLDAATRILTKGSIGDRRLNPLLAKSIKAIQPPKQPIARGFTGEGKGQMAKSLTAEQIKKLSPIALAKAMVDEYDAETVKALRARVKMLEEESAGTIAASESETDDSMSKADGEVEGTVVAPEVASEVEEIAEEPTPKMNPGADFLTAVHTDVKGLVERLLAAETATEKPEVLEAASAFAETLQGMLTEIEGAASSIYPDMPKMAGTGEVAAADEELVKSWIASKSTNQYKLAGLAVKLQKSLGTPKVMPAVIQSVIRDLQLLNKSAKSWKPAVAPAVEGVDRKEFDALTKAVEKLVDSLGKLPA